MGTTGKVLIIIGILVVIVVMVIGWLFGIRNNMVTLEEGINNGWAQVQNQYQRRYDLIPNLVETVKGFAKQEKEVLLGVTEARAKAGGVMNIGPEVLNDPQAFSRFQETQAGLGSALQRLLVVVERYPELKSNQNFLTLQAQLEGTENRIAVERKRFNDLVLQYNSYVRKFPQMFVANLFGFNIKAYFQAVSGAEEVPRVEF
jgi:LemA protein